MSALRDFLGYLTQPSPGDMTLTANGDQLRAGAAGMVASVQQYPFLAKGDGNADDTAAIQAAHDAVYNNGKGPGGVVFLPRTAGQYRLTSSIVFQPQVRFVGEMSRYSTASWGSNFKAAPSGNFTNGPVAAPYLFKQAGANNLNFWHAGSFEHLGFDCNNVAGGIHFWRPGENSLIDCIRVDNAGSSARSAANVVTNGTNVVTVPDSSLTSDDVNALVTKSDLPANTKIDLVLSATSAQLNNAATGSSTSAMTINRPMDAVVFDGGAPTGLIRSLNGINNAGALLRLTNHNQGSWVILSLSGDSNGGGLLRISAAATGFGPISVTVLNFKAENPTTPTAQDPLFLVDNSDVVALNVIGGSALTTTGSRDIVRLDQSVVARGGPSVELVGIEGTKAFATSYTNILNDTRAAVTIPAQPLDGSGNKITRFAYPHVLYNRDLIMHGGTTITI